MDSREQARRVLQLMDLTSLNADDDARCIHRLCEQARTPYGAPAALCVYPRFVPQVRAELQALGLGGVGVATVVNFPGGGADAGQAALETAQAVALGADEVDVVFPYRALLAGDEQTGAALVRACKTACGRQARLKVILETGLLPAQLVRRASELAIEGGADFLKTSTGKVAAGASLEAARIMLTVIRERNPAVGFKAAGGIRSLAQAEGYLALAGQLLGEDWITPAHMRFGASGLLAELLAVLGGQAARAAPDSDY